MFEENKLQKCLEKVKEITHDGGNLSGNDVSLVLLNTINLELLTEFPMDKTSLLSLLDSLIETDSLTLFTESKPKTVDDQFLGRFNLFSKVLVKNSTFLFQNSQSLFTEFDLDEEFLASLQTLFKYNRALISYLSKFDYNKLLVQKNEGTHLSLYYSNRRNELVEFLNRAHLYKPELFKTTMKVVSGRELNKNLRKFASSCRKLNEIFEACFTANEEKERKIEDLNEQKFVEIFLVNENFLKELKTKNLDKLTKMFRYTMTRRDRTILAEIYSHDPKLDCLIFKLEQGQSIEVLSKQAKVTDFIETKLDPALLTNSIQNFPIHRKLAEIDAELPSNCEEFEFESLVVDESVVHERSVYDPIYILPNLYNLLDFGSFNCLNNA